MAAECFAEVMAQAGAFDHGGDVSLFFGGELVDGFEFEDSSYLSVWVVFEPPSPSSSITGSRCRRGIARAR